MRVKAEANTENVRQRLLLILDIYDRHRHINPSFQLQSPVLIAHSTEAEMKVFVVFALLVAVALAIPQEGYNYPAPGGQGSQFPTGTGQAQYPSVPAQYAFQWDVNHEPSGNFYGHKEEREDANTQGSYYVQLADGRRLLVEYYVDATGYHPTVTFEGEAQYPSGGNQGYGQSGQGGNQGSPSQLYGPPSK
ncbi:pro-resilin-like [Penaeus japonicus]|uniref:pro-resilin-like n=1 Tax=Penaeus japonicus TaxID=27405 RepID=UPI001C713D13|nr:pro-resilin-like [Penaeus japonicus]